MEAENRFNLVFEVKKKAFTAVALLTEHFSKECTSDWHGVRRIPMSKRQQQPASRENRTHQYWGGRPLKRSTSDLFVDRPRMPNTIFTGKIERERDEPCLHLSFSKRSQRTLESTLCIARTDWRCRRRTSIGTSLLGFRLSNTVRSSSSY